MPDTARLHRPCPPDQRPLSGSGFLLAALCGLPGLITALLIVATGGGWGWALLAWLGLGPLNIALLALLRPISPGCHRACRARTTNGQAPRPKGKPLNV